MDYWLSSYTVLQGILEVNTPFGENQNYKNHFSTEERERNNFFGSLNSTNIGEMRRVQLNNNFVK